MARYVRDEGPICYGVDLLEQPKKSRLKTLLVGDGMAWLWRSEWYEGASAHGTRRERGPTPVTDETLPFLVEDAAFRYPDGYGKFIALFAAAPEWWNGEPGALDEAIRGFARGDAEPIWAVTIQVGDAQHEHLFVPQQPREEVSRFRSSVGPPLETYRTLPYRRLGTAALEVQLGLGTSR